jgi:hypothetical protein
MVRPANLSKSFQRASYDYSFSESASSRLKMKIEFLSLVSVCAWFAGPAEIGLVVRRALGEPIYFQMESEN